MNDAGRFEKFTARDLDPRALATPEIAQALAPPP
jgi:hypothetical protein